MKERITQSVRFRKIYTKAEMQHLLGAPANGRALGFCLDYRGDNGGEYVVEWTQVTEVVER